MDIAALLTSALFIGGVVLGLQLADAVLSFVDARRLVDEVEADALTRIRMRELAWTVIVTAALAVIVAFGVDSAARLVWDEGRPVAGTLILLGLTVLSFAIGIVAVVAVVRWERPTYARIRRDLRDRSKFAVEHDELLEFEERLARADQLRERRSRGGTLVRVLGILVMCMLTLLAVSQFAVGFAIGFGIAALLDLAAAVLSLRTRQITTAALEAALETQRAEVVALLERARIPARGSVPGLGNRVARALAILRDQQK